MTSGIIQHMFELPGNLIDYELMIYDLLGAPTSASAAATISSASATTAQTSTSLTVASTSGRTTSTVSTTVSPTPKLQPEITGRTFEKGEDSFDKEALYCTAEKCSVGGIAEEEEEDEEEEAEDLPPGQELKASEDPNEGEEVKEEDIDTFFDLISKSISPSISGTSITEAISSNEAIPEEQIEQSKALVKEYMRLPFSFLRHPAKFTSFKNALSTLINVHALSDAADETLKYFSKELPSFRLSFETASIKLTDVDEQLNRGIFVQTKLKKAVEENSLLKQESNNLKTRILHLEAEIEKLEADKQRAESELAICEEKKSKNFAQARGFKAESIKHESAYVELQAYRAELHQKLSSIETSWENFRNSIEGQL
ncbi:hypothetical protein U1Q18_022898 [Sarracenia purpurea var. burkii]